MQTQLLTLRMETPADYREVETLTREAFWNQYRPGCNEHYLVHTLRAQPAFIPALDVVAVQNGQIVGNIMYTHASVVRDQGQPLPVLCFGPISVLPSCQRQGVGGQLIRHTLQLAREAGHSAVLILGDPLYYSRYGFLPAEQFGIATADNHYSAALQAIELQPGALANASGIFVEDEAFSVEDEAAAEFDSQFPPKPLVEDNAAQRRFHEIIALSRPRG